MISNDLLQSNYLGRDGFKWWVGVIADPSLSGWGNAKESENKRRFKPGSGIEHDVYERRCKVRILGYHTISDKDGYVLKDSDLPWAHILVPAGTGTGIHGIGGFHEYQGGESVMGFFLDGDDAQQPVIIGGFGRGPQMNDTEEAKPSEKTDEADCIIKPFKPRLNSNLGTLHLHKVKPLSTKPTDTDKEGKSKSNPSTGKTETVYKNGNDSSTMSAPAGGDSDESGNAAARALEKLNPLTKPACNPSENALSGIQKEINAIIKTLTAIQEYKEVYYDGAVNQVSSLSSQIGGQVKTISGYIRQILEIVKGDLVEFLNEKWDIAKELLPETGKTILGMSYVELIEFLLCAFDEFIEQFGIFDTSLETILENLLGNIIDAALCAVEKIITDILNKFLEPIFNAIQGILDSFAQILGDIGAVFAEAIGTALSIFNRIRSFFSCLPSRFQCAESASWSLAGPSQKQKDDYSNILSQIAIPEIPLPEGFDPEDAVPIQCDANIGYLFPPEIVFSFGDAKAKAFVGDGKVIGIYLEEKGKGYSPLTPPAISIQQPGVYGTGAGAKAIAIVDDDGSISNVCLTSPGSGYVSIPEVAATSISILTAEDFGLLPLPKTSDQVDAIPYLKDIYIKTPGIGYDDSDTILINGEDPSVYGLELDMDTGPEGFISKINIQNNNNTPPVFKDLPQISVLSDTGVGAIAVACLGFIIVESQEKDDSGNITAFTADGQKIAVNAGDIKTSVNCFLQ